MVFAQELDRILLRKLVFSGLSTDSGFRAAAFLVFQGISDRYCYSKGTGAFMCGQGCFGEGRLLKGRLGGNGDRRALLLIDYQFVGKYTNVL